MTDLLCAQSNELGYHFACSFCSKTINEKFGRRDSSRRRPRAWRRRRPRRGLCRSRSLLRFDARAGGGAICRVNKNGRRNNITDSAPETRAVSFIVPVNYASAASAVTRFDARRPTGAVGGSKLPLAAMPRCETSVL
ncbi:hypothetical protein EVAR_95109_1 [Eumeta japonica]|uniref:Uncharacterized protein n=1 Tax=Eumeta variegata TaxID=151549 RepID=A0A4C1TC21_EUMVA|nr:hypothetical protein EVAR_95109_1 [Eumeta japonica]